MLFLTKIKDAIIGINVSEKFEWIKKNWEVIATFLLLLFVSCAILIKINSTDIANLKQQYALQLEQDRKLYESEMNALQNSAQQQLETQKRIIEEHQQELDLIQKDYEQKLLEIEQQKKINVKKISKNIDKNPDAAIKEIADKYGFEIIAIPDGAK